MKCPGGVEVLVCTNCIFYLDDRHGSGSIRLFKESDKLGCNFVLLELYNRTAKGESLDLASGNKLIYY